MPSTDPRPLTVVLCSGSDCAKDERKAYRSLARQLDDADVEFVCSPCLGVCHGPVAVVGDERGRAVVLQKIRSKARRKRLVSAVGSGRLSRAAEAGPRVDESKRRDKALRRAGRAIPRKLVPG